MRLEISPELYKLSTLNLSSRRLQKLQAKISGHVVFIIILLLYLFYSVFFFGSISVCVVFLDEMGFFLTHLLYF